MVMPSRGGGTPPPPGLQGFLPPGYRNGGGGQQQSLSGLQGEVYMGSYRAPSVSSQTRKNIIEGGGTPPPRDFRKRDRIMTANEAYLQFFQWGRKKQQDFIAQATLSGLIQQGEGLLEASRAWKTLVTEAAIYNDAGQKISPWDIMSTYVSAHGGAGAWVLQGDFEVNTATGERRYVGPQFKTTTDSRVDLTDPATAQAIATQVFQQAMGRNPGKGELEAFASALRKAEKAHPLVSTTTTEFDMTTGEAIGRDTTTSGGMTAEARAMIGQNQAKKDSEYGAYQAATTYYGALEQAVYGSPE